MVQMDGEFLYCICPQDLLPISGRRPIDAVDYTVESSGNYLLYMKPARQFRVVPHKVLER